VWISSGGGSARSADGKTVNVTINGALAPGTAQVGKATAGFGYFTSDTR
jgi:hypothetical protein